MSRERPMRVGPAGALLFLGVWGTWVGLLVLTDLTDSGWIWVVWFLGIPVAILMSVFVVSVTLSTIATDRLRRRRAAG